MIRGNTIAENGRAGIAVIGAASGNAIESNNATGNGTLNIAPSLMFDLFDLPPLDNTWTNNQGRFNITAASEVTVAALQSVAGEAFRAGGCLSGTH